MKLVNLQVSIYNKLFHSQQRKLKTHSQFPLFINLIQFVFFFFRQLLYHCVSLIVSSSMLPTVKIKAFLLSRFYFCFSLSIDGCIKCLDFSRR